MAHVIFRVGDAVTNDHIAQLIVDGQDITNHVLADGFKIDRTGADEFDTGFVQIRLAVEGLEVELPEAVVTAAPSPRRAKLDEPATVADLHAVRDTLVKKLGDSARRGAGTGARNRRRA
jgi:hypothetical protein